MLEYVGGSLIGLYLLWLFYLAVMNLQRVYEAGQMKKWVFWMAMPIVIFGILLDILINIFVLSVIMLEPPQELTCSRRLSRWNREAEPGWRIHVVRFFEPILDPFDPSGKHL